MSKKYLPPTVPTIITNDLFLASFLHAVGCTLDHVETNGRKRVSFVFVGDRVHELREAYRTGPVQLDLRLFRESLHFIRRQMDAVIPEERSFTHAPTISTNRPSLQSVA